MESLRFFSDISVWQATFLGLELLICLGLLAWLLGFIPIPDYDPETLGEDLNAKLEDLNSKIEDLDLGIVEDLNRGTEYS